MTDLTPLYPRDRDWHPPALAPDYKSSRARAPEQKLLKIGQTINELTGPVFGHDEIAAGDADLLTNYAGADQEAVGQRLLIHGRVLDEDACPLPGILLEIWQANAGGRYRHRNDTYLAVIDPNFGGCGRTLTGADGQYSFRTVMPGAYPWQNGPNSWRPAHIHFSIFGTAFAQRLITQCYFEGDPLIALCPIVQAIPDPAAIDRLVARLDLDATLPLDTLAYRFDIVLRGRAATCFENRMEGT